MLGKMERKILAGLLAASMCLTCLPAGMGQVRAEEGMESNAALAEQTDAIPEVVQEPLTDVDEKVTAEVPGMDVPEESEGAKDPGEDVSEDPEGM